jgi:hypothetical protein
MYTDPGSGLFFAQVLAAAAFTAGYRFRRFLKAIRGVVRRRTAPDD